MFPRGPITIAATSYREVGLTVRMPARISPDLYFIGFVVTPVQQRHVEPHLRQSDRLVRHDRRARAPRHAPRRRPRCPGIRARRHASHATLHVHNVGKAAAIFWGENDTTATPGARRPASNDSTIRSSRSAVRGRSPCRRDRRSSSRSVTMHVRIFYPGRVPGTTTQIVVTKHVVIVQPAAIALISAILIAGGVYLTTRRRKRRKPRSRAPGPQRGPAPTRRRGAARRPTSRREPVSATKATAARVDTSRSRTPAPESRPNPAAEAAEPAPESMRSLPEDQSAFVPA